MAILKIHNIYDAINYLSAGGIVPTEDVIEDNRQAVNLRHATDPQPGDYWEDHLVGVLVVLKITKKGNVIFCDKKFTSKEDQSWYWNLKKTNKTDKIGFRNYLSYQTMPSFWAYVHPEHHLGAVKIFKEIQMKRKTKKIKKLEKQLLKLKKQS